MFILLITTPVCVINKTSGTVDIPQAAVTALFAVISGFILYSIKSVIDGYWLRYLRKYKNFKAEITYVLMLHARAYSKSAEKPDEIHEEASKVFRDIGSRLGAFAIERPKICWGVPKADLLSDVAHEFVGLSNNMYSKEGVTADLLHEHNEKRVEKISKILMLE